MGKQYFKINNIIAFITLFISFLIYLLTMAPTASFWDCGEFIATSYIMGVPHPPGSPLYLLLGNLFSQIPTFSDIGARVNLMSPISSAFSVMFLYLITVYLIEEFRGITSSYKDAIINYGSSFVGALTFSVTDSHWFNAVEAEVYAMSTFFTGIVVWLILLWSRKEGTKGNVRYIIVIAYMIGIATGVHLLNLLTLPFLALIVYFKKRKYTLSSFIMLIPIPLIVYLIIYQGIIKGLPNIAQNFGITSIIFIIIIFIGLIYYCIKNKYFTSATIFTSFFLVIVGYSTYASIFIRAQQAPFINENDPSTIPKAISYLNREQYGDWSITDRAQSLKNSSYSNRWTLSRQNPSKEDVSNFVFDYQFKEMYLRYFAWQFIGRGDNNWPLFTKKGDYIKSLDGINPLRYMFPFAIVFGMFGIFYHFNKDWKRGLAILSLFLATGLMIILYLNQYDPQPRERDYSYVGSFFAFSIWIGIGIAGTIEALQKLFNDKKGYFIILFLSLITFLMPITMLKTDYKEHNRSGNYVAWDYAYNMLNSCEPYAIIFTNGDNDTFPLWYLQEVEGVRKDVRVVNLSLLNTDWYIEQMRDFEPKIPIQMNDNDISNIAPMRWEAKEMNIPGPENGTDSGLTWILKPTYHNKFLRVQDIMIYRLIQACKWERPIYFAVTVSDDNRIGLDEYLQMEGMVFKLYPKKVSSINYEKMKQNIIQSPDVNYIIRTPKQYNEYLNTGKGFYHYRNMNNPDVYFNFNIQRLVQNYRASFLQLVISSINGANDKKVESIEILNNMENYFPSDMLPYNNDKLELQVAQIYFMLGDENEYIKRLGIIENRDRVSNETLLNVGQMYLSELNDYDKAYNIFYRLYEKDPTNIEYMYSTVQSLARMDRIDNAVQLLENWLIRYPNDSQIQELLNSLKSQLNN